MRVPLKNVLLVTRVQELTIMMNFTNIISSANLLCMVILTVCTTKTLRYTHYKFAYTQREKIINNKY